MCNVCLSVHAPQRRPVHRSAQCLKLHCFRSAWSTQRRFKRELVSTIFLTTLSMAKKLTGDDSTSHSFCLSQSFPYNSNTGDIENVEDEHAIFRRKD